MNYWNQTPLFRLMFPFVIGIFAAVYFQVGSHYIIYAVSGLSLFVFAGLFFKRLKLSYSLNPLLGVFVTILFFLAGYLTVTSDNPKNDSRYFEKSEGDFFICSISEPLQEKSGSFKAFVEINYIKAKRGWRKTKGKSVVYFEKNSFSKKLKYGDCIVSRNKFNPVEGPKNPGEFDYRRYLALNNIFTRAYLKENDYKLINEHSGNSFMEYAFNLREQLLSVFRLNIKDKDACAVASALVVGSMDDIDRELMNSYSVAGVIHVLSVSGLHIGLVYLVLNAMLFFMDRTKYLKIFKTLFLILFLWFYALITGFSPSVLRAAMMFSLLIFGKSLGRYTNPYNTLAASAFILLLFDPMLVLNVGFQLSYLAVVGIMLIHPEIYKRFTFESRLADWTWQMISVSIAAHISTFPLVLYYFHQLPNYFILANLLVIPLATVIMYGGIVLLAVSKFTLLSLFLGKLLGLLLYLLNYIVVSIEKMPGSLWRNVNISFSETLILYLSILMFLIYYSNRKAILLITGMTFLSIIFISQFYNAVSANNQKRFIVYHIKNGLAIDFIDGRKSVLLTDLLNPGKNPDLSFHIQPNWCQLGIDNNCYVSGKENYNKSHLKIKKSFAQFYGKRVGWLDSFPENVSQKIKLDYLIVSKDSKFSIKQLKEKFDPGLLVFDNSFRGIMLKYKNSECLKCGLPFYNISEKGALVIDFN